MATFLFIHGSWHGSWSWDRIVPYLKKEGHTILSPNLPGRGCCQTPHSEITLQTHVDFLKNLIQNLPGQVILVGHSFGGIIATQLANEVPHKIAHIIYLCAFLPQNGESLMEIAKSLNHKHKPLAMKVDPTQTTISLDPSYLPYLFFNCCSLEEQHWAIKQICVEPFRPMTTKVTLRESLLENIPKTYIECTKDNALTIDAQKAMHTKYRCKVISLPTDHSPFLSAPLALTRALLSST